MKFTKPLFADSDAEAAHDPAQEERQMALEYLAEAWNSAEDDGIESYALAHASLFAALTALVTSHGSEAVALLVEGLPERIRAGEYDLERVIQ
ncbi:MAG TPA: hypothetical protein VIN06_14705 [Devosia sp.]